MKNVKTEVSDLKFTFAPKFIIMNSFYYFLLLIGIFSCSVPQNRSANKSSLKQLKSYMTGSFNSAQQAAKDSSYFDITLHMYPIWKEREGDWLYVEQSVTANQNKPYRQRVYKLEQTDDETFKSRIFTLPNPESYVGGWKNKDGFANLNPEDITERAGCEVNLKFKELGMYSGSTGIKTCESTLRGANYATSIVKVFPDKIISWDQGFDSDGKQVWGATEGGYIFIKY